MVVVQVKPITDGPVKKESQWIKGVENKIIIIGGGVFLVLILLILIMKS
jgi:hypothetical protein